MRAVVIRVLVARVVRSCAVGAAVLCTASALATPELVQAPLEDTQASPAETRATRGAARVSRLLTKHGCWSGEAPEGAARPGHAVVTVPGVRPRLVDAAVGFGIWLEGEPGVLHGFCP